MTSRYDDDDDDWSDSEDEGQTSSEIETSVLLGIPDGEIEEAVDVTDPSVSRIGGLPAFLPNKPLPFSSSLCKSCSNPMPLLVQIWCPFEGSAMDRALYLWGCERATCQRKEGSVRAWRGLKYNTKYAAKLEKKKVKEIEKSQRLAAEKANLEREKQQRSINPFSLSSSASNNMTFGLGSQLFAESTSEQKPSMKETPKDILENEASAGEGENDVNALADEVDNLVMDSPELSDEWKSAPSYHPVYLSTVSEYLPPPSKTKPKVTIDDGLDEPQKSNGPDWGLETWEKFADVDGAFERFTKRIASEPEQCVRYDLKGVPLLFGSKDKVAERLYPPPPPPAFNTKPGFATSVSQRRVYDPEAVGKCDVCGKRRVFECQLMPNLINVLRGQKRKMEEPKATPPKSEEERKVELLDVGMEWGTCFIFSCAEDCCNGESECWREEVVLVQWDD